MTADQPDSKLSRREFLQRGLCGTGLIAVSTVTALAAIRSRANQEEMVWQLDPAKCIQCGQCATECVLPESAVKCVHTYNMCGYCDLCFGYFQPGAKNRTSAVENQVCPTGAIKRTFIEEPYFEYEVDESLCIGCAKCVKTCNAFGNGSLQMQVRHDRCLNCNECAIARNCPAQAFRRVPASQPSLMKGREEE